MMITIGRWYRIADKDHELKMMILKCYDYGWMEIDFMV